MTPTRVARWLVVAIALTPTLARAEFQVNTYTTLAQFRPAVAASS